MRNLYEYGKQCMNELDAINIPYSKSVYFIANNRAKKRWGRCESHGNQYSIEINSLLLDERNSEDGLKNTIIHELLHTIKGCMNHGTKWKNYADKVNRTYHYDISRCNSYQDKGICEEIIEKVKRETEIKNAAKPIYGVRCEKCGHEYIRHKLSKIITNPEDYRCGMPNCNGHIVRFA